MFTLYDTTLRDGTQREGLALSADDKLRICQRLDALGIDYIEGGFPGSNPKDVEFFERARELDLKHAVVTAFGSTCRKDTCAADDEGLRALIETGCKALCVFGKAWDLHVTETLRTTLPENLRMVRESVAYLKSEGRTVFFDAEHFFDGYRANPGYALDVCRAAHEGGADAIVLCDTNGGTMPQDTATIVGDVRAALPGAVLGMHAHNDAGFAVANSVVAVDAGVTHVQGTINGYGERAGNADLVSIIPALKLKMGIDCVTDEQLATLTEVAHFVAETANLAPDAHQPYVGVSAFAHKGGVHAAAVARLAETYEHIRPELVGNTSRVIVSELAGRASLVAKASELGLDLTEDAALVQRVLAEVKRREHMGYAYEVADGSLALLIMREAGLYRPVFSLESFDVTVNKRETGSTTTDAVVRLMLGDQRLVAWAEAAGPVNALDRALRAALDGQVPGIERIELVDYKVRVLEGERGTGKVTRVLIESSDGEREWGTVGVSENIIQASWEALVDALDYGLVRPAGKG